MKKILISAYDIDPYSGSESATGWNYVYELSRFKSIVAVTRKNNRKEIERFCYEQKVDLINLNFIYFDLPRWASFWKRGARGSMLYFYLWQIGVAISQFHNRKNYDVVHALNFHCDWIPSFLWLLNRPFIWGPVNHHEPIPSSYLSGYPSHYKRIEKLKLLVKLLFWNIDPFMHICKRKASVIFVGHEKVSERLSINKKKIIELNQVAADDPDEVDVSLKKGMFSVVAVGRIVPMKGFDLVVRGFSQFIQDSSIVNVDKVRLQIVGDGPCRNFVERICEDLGIRGFVEFTGWVDKAEVRNRMRDANVFCFPSHEGAGMVLAEALSVGTPIICLDNYGPGCLVNDEVAIRVTTASEQLSVDGICQALTKLYMNSDLNSEMSDSARDYYCKEYTWASKARRMSCVYDKVLGEL